MASARAFFPPQTAADLTRRFCADFGKNAGRFRGATGSSKFFPSGRSSRLFGKPKVGKKIAGAFSKTN
jgi:hypothetical protein